MLLGPEHAAEHARARAAQAGGNRLSPSEERQLAKEDRREAEKFAELTASAAAPSASEVGRWTRAPFRLPHAAVHAAMLPTGEVMFWGTAFPNEPRNRGKRGRLGPGEGLRKRCVHGGSAAQHRPGRARPSGDGYGAHRLLEPPGYYMLFLLNNGVPSVASWVQLTANAPDAPP